MLHFSVADRLTCVGVLLCCVKILDDMVDEVAETVKRLYTMGPDGQLESVISASLRLPIGTTGSIVTKAMYTELRKDLLALLAVTPVSSMAGVRDVFRLAMRVRALHKLMNTYHVDNHGVPRMELDTMFSPFVPGMYRSLPFTLCTVLHPWRDCRLSPHIHCNA